MQRRHSGQEPKQFTGRLIGYARVSTPEQDVDMQLQALRRAGVMEDNLHWETVSGVAKRRHKLELALIDARNGDVFVVYKLDRIGRSMRDLLDKVVDLESRGVGFRSITETIDTTTPGGRLLFHVIGALAQFERDLIRERTRDGMAAAKGRGVQVGKPLWFTPTRQKEFERRYKAGETVGEIVESWGKSRQLIYSRYTKRKLDRLRKKR